MTDERIDTRDMPEVHDWSGAKRGQFFRPIKRQITLRLDADVIEWFKVRQPKGYQTEINRALREYADARPHRAGPRPQSGRKKRKIA